MDTIIGLGQFAARHLDVALAFVGAFALLATRTPNKVDDRVAQTLLDVINFFGANVGKAKNGPE